ncbi:MULTISPECIES: hypothetical protein [Pseudoalteromonas]|uniref:FAD-binding oxidoreductase n=1 Tax=Pseudoalteromonas maricaloris TaxID=184924 RepID=A0A8I2KKZ6_9GAMM|nr:MULTISPECIES: hypothetical protein [Pseudoalteromonas]KID33051.1 hypothetical protein QT15_21645 [Pseudoalteromonas flavipulchra NCIMB 2033 = ATCC BAA-314]MBD0781218.1 hypothetical protein [Pseudoalteromonas flavipulchra]MBE0373415.1 hypothetical protein [Pseudoalteromonas flavipulchra NCIMB 2033 = ATCC BAA-314]NLR20061.1 hypothetical protein [Pseudoalteromonas maricaloris]QUI63973.1 hypothetical protein GSF04_16355 [Pseudoalteromonas sp. A22]
MIKKIVIIFSLLFAASHGSADELKPFTSDGCSAFPDGTLAQNELWLSCCTAHDLAYWKGGTAIERENADIALQKCVAAVGQKEVATLMLAGVRLGGLPYLPTPFRWGYGWSYPRRYAELTAEEIEQVNKHMAKLALDKK